MTVEATGQLLRGAPAVRDRDGYVLGFGQSLNA